MQLADDRDNSSGLHLSNDKWLLIQALRKSSPETIAAHEPLALSFKDPDDIPILACALSGRADVFVTGDNALSGLGAAQKMPILSPRQMWQKLAGMEGKPA